MDLEATSNIFEQTHVDLEATSNIFELRAPPPFVVFSATQNCSDWCLSLVFVGFNLLILCWLAGANGVRAGTSW